MSDLGHIPNFDERWARKEYAQGIGRFNFDPTGPFGHLSLSWNDDHGWLVHDRKTDNTWSTGLGSFNEVVKAMVLGRVAKKAAAQGQKPQIN